MTRILQAYLVGRLETNRMDDGASQSESTAAAYAVTKVDSGAQSHANASLDTSLAVPDLSRDDGLELLHARLAMLSLSGFALSSGFLILAEVMLVILSSTARAIQDLSSPNRIIHMIATAGFLVAWAVLKKVKFSLRALRVFDAALIAFACASLSQMGIWGFSGSIGTLTAGLGVAHALILRAVLVPSSGRRTLLTCIAASSLTLALAIVSYSSVAWHELPSDRPPIVRLVIMTLWFGVSSGAATLASTIIWGLRSQVRETKRIGQYVLRERLGQGGMGVVFRATHILLRRETAIKLILPTVGSDIAIQRFEREVRITASLSHPNTIAVYDYGRTPDGAFYYAMEYLDGFDLDSLVRQNGPLPAGRVISLLSQLCGSLSEAHERGLIHRDIKPANVVATCRGGEPDVVKVLDFGLARAMDTRSVQGGDGRLTEANVPLGTPLYMAPESITTPDGAGPLADLYAVAATGYYLLTGTDVFTGNSIIEVCSHHLHTPPTSPSERLGRAVAADLERLLLRGLAKDSKERPQSARAFREELLRCVDAQSWTLDAANEWWNTTAPRLKMRRSIVPAPGAPHEGSAVNIDFAHR